MARPPKPVSELKAAGTYRKDRHERPQIAAKKVEGLPPMPAHLPNQCRADWQRVCGILTTAKILTEGDLDAVGRYCVLLWMSREATANLEATGPVIEYETRHGKTVKPNPSARVVLDCARELRALGERLGFDPVSRQRLDPEKLAGGEEEKEKDDPFEALFMRRKPQQY